MDGHVAVVVSDVRILFVYLLIVERYERLECSRRVSEWPCS